MSDAVNDVESLDVMSSVRRKVSTGKPVGRNKTTGVDKLVLTASLRVAEPINITFPEKPDLADVSNKAEDIVAAGDPPKSDGDKAPDTKISSPEADREIKVADTTTKDVPAEMVDDRDILTSESSVLKNDGLIDEDMLRDMISDIVRQELQGDLGEKITRNVRRLVRREIHRTMVSNQLE